MDMSIVIPVYGCRAALVELCDRLTMTISRLVKDYEIILVNDNCPQNSWEIIEQICNKDKHIVGINLSRNFGQIQAITAGLDYSTGEWVAVMDCDLQDKPEEIANLYHTALEGYDAVFAKRKKRKDTFLKKFISKVFYKIYSFASDGYYDPEVCNFSICSRKVIDSYCKMREVHRAYVIYIKWLGFRQKNIEVDCDPRKEGKSSYNMKKRLKLAGEILISQSDKILKYTVLMGVSITLLAAIAVIFLIIQYFIGKSLQGWTSTIIAIFFMGGAIMSSIGIVGLYVGNIFIQVKERPLYVIRDLLNDKN